MLEAEEHMIDETKELTIDDCKELLEKAESFWSTPHATFKSDYLFAHGKNQWESELEEKRRTAHRAVKTYNIVPGFIRPLVNAVRQSPPSISLYPASQDTDKESAKILGGVIRHIEYCSNAQRAYTHALEQVAEGGLGAWRVIPTTKKNKTTRYTNEVVQTQFGPRMIPKKNVELVDKTEISIQQIDDPTSIYFDPSATLPDFSDANWVLYKRELSVVDYAREYPNGTASSSNDAVVIYEYWYINDSGFVDFVLFDENEILIHENLELTILPFIVIAGGRIDANGEITFKSLTSEIRAPQQEINWLKSEAISSISQAPKSSWIIDADAIAEGDEDAWANSSTDPDVVLRKKKGSEVIPIVPPGPPVGYMELSNQSIELSRQITGIYPDPSTQAALSNASGKAIQYQQANSQIQTYHFIDALNFGIKRTGEILLDMISVYYSNDDIRVSMGVDNTYQHVSIGPTNVPNVENIDLTFNQYGVVISTGPTYSTQKEQFSEQLMKFAQGNPAMMPMIADIVVRYSNIPGSEELADRFRVMLPEPVQAIIQNQQNKQDPSMLIMQMNQMGMQMKQLQQQNQMLQAELQKASDVNQIKLMELKSKKDINDDNNRAKFALQDAQHDQEQRLLEMEGKLDLLLSMIGKKPETNNNKINKITTDIDRLSPM